MPKNEPDGFVPIEVEVGDQNPPAVSEVDFTPEAPAPVKPQPAASKKED
jgi:hypothetical protein